MLIWRLFSAGREQNIAHSCFWSMPDNFFWFPANTFTLKILLGESGRSLSCGWEVGGLEDFVMAWPVLERRIARWLYHANQLSILIWPMETLKPQIRKCQVMDGFLPSSGAWMSVPAQPAGWPWTSLFPLPAQSPLWALLCCQQEKINYLTEGIR